MRSKKLAGNKPSAATQRYIDIAQIQDDIVVLKDGSMRAVILTSSLNFALKSPDEQAATVGAYVQFLNSLKFPIQILIQSRKLNIEKYLDELEQKYKEQTNELLKMQIAEYRRFVAELIELGEIMSKRFYVVVPFSPGGDEKKSFFDRFTSLFNNVILRRSAPQDCNLWYRSLRSWTNWEHPPFPRWRTRPLCDSSVYIFLCAYWARDDLVV